MWVTVHKNKSNRRYFSTTHLTLYIQLPGHILKSLGTVATPEIILQLHIPETMYQLPHKMADQE